MVQRGERLRLYNSGRRRAGCLSTPGMAPIAIDKSTLQLRVFRLVSVVVEQVYTAAAATRDPPGYSDYPTDYRLSQKKHFRW